MISRLLCRVAQGSAAFSIGMAALIAHAAGLAMPVAVWAQGSLYGGVELPDPPPTVVADLRTATMEMTRASLADEGFELRWASVAPLRDAGAGPIREIYLLGAVVLGRTSDNQIVAFDADTGNFRWIRRLGRPDRETFPPAFNPPRVSSVGKPDRPRITVTNYTQVYTLDALTGEPLSTIELPFMPATAFIREGKIAICGGENSRVYFLDAEKGYRIENRLLPANVTGQPIFDDPDERGDRSSVYITDTNGRVYAFGTGIVQYWQFPAGNQNFGRVSAPLTRTPKIRSVDSKGVVSILDYALVFVPTDDNSLFALRKQSGQIAWQKRSNSAFRESAYAVVGRPDSPLDQDRVYIRDADRNLYALDPIKGEDLWTLPDAGRFLCAARDPALSIFTLQDTPGSPDAGTISRVANIRKVVKTPEGDRNIYFPQVKARYRFGDVSIWVANTEDPILFGATSDGRFYAVKVGSGEVRQRRNAERPPVVRVLSSGAVVATKNADDK